jgi:phosphatidate cytidylyltransferase
MAPVALACVWLGGLAFYLVVIAAMVGLAIEWLRLCRRTRRWGRLRPAGLAYVLLGGLALLWLRADPVVGRVDILFLLAVVWAGDIGAYLVGRWMGGARLAPRVSPGKTWSGAIGGLLVAVAVGLFAAHLLSDAAGWRAIAIAVVLNVVAQSGDLLESFVKRRLEVKDSGHLIPGHGGLFDRLDSLLAAAPVAALLALTVGRGVVLWQ